MNVRKIIVYSCGHEKMRMCKPEKVASLLEKAKNELCPDCYKAKYGKPKQQARTYTRKQEEMIEHNESIIDDNIAFGRRFPQDYSESDIKKYVSESKKQLREFKAFLRNGGTPVYDKETDMYVIPPKEPEE